MIEPIKIEKYRKEKPLYGVGYHNFTTYTTFDASELESSSDGFLHLYWDDFVGHKWFIEDNNSRKCIFHIDGCTRFKQNFVSRSALVFKTKGDVEVSGAGEARICNLTFDNDGDVLIKYDTRPTKTGKSVTNGKRKKGNTGMFFSFPNTMFIANNNGNFTISINDNHRDRIFINSRCRFDIRNKGDVFINTHRSICNAKFFNKGGVESHADSIYDSEFNNNGHIYLTVKLLHDIIYRNSGDVNIEFLHRSRFSRINNFHNKGKVNIQGDMPILSFSNLVFNNSGPVYVCAKDDEHYCREITCKDTVHSVIHFTRKVKQVTFNNVTSIQCFQALFENSSYVNGESITSLYGTFTFNNLYNVDLRNLVSDYDPSKRHRELRFTNKGDLNLKSFDNVRFEDCAFPLIRNSGTCYLKSNDDDILDKNRVRSQNNGFLIIPQEGNSEYSVESYLKRHDVKIKDGVATLYKAIGKKSKKSVYDNIDTIWNIGDYIEHPEWSPYNNEIGYGKYIASAYPHSFYTFYKGRGYDIIELEVNLYDLYEWPSFAAKYPQFIGFRAAKVVRKL